MNMHAKYLHTTGSAHDEMPLMLQAVCCITTLSHLFSTMRYFFSLFGLHSSALHLITYLIRA